MGLELALTLLALGASLWMRPWRMLAAGSALLTPMLASVVLLPWLWALPNLHHMPLQLHWSGAPLVTLMLGWPLAVLTLTAIGAITTVISSTSAEAALGLVVWQGLVPATFTLLLGAALRRWVSHHPFVYVLGRGFLGAVLCIFLSSVLAQSLGHEVPYVSSSLSMIGLWLMAWGDAFITGMVCAIFLAYRPQWLATWSDQMYLKV
ncbi:hypothetical protein B9Z39_06975 [Limnohabitans sp. JirII-29]|uniref:hypothetical protein n=1 Tax=Limnohabitans sp. JirII-29 TaxID=1835756 RepID=UPI000D3A8523|nr:hypothetical protein [Limnohabitans sp. JirII-29]PUE28477.1 hypothetical protein B9Z39_06975 [Limnohabitans sp. JirII-29]